VYAFSVSVNGRHVCTAGIGSNAGLIVAVHWLGGFLAGADGHLGVHVGGLDDDARQHVRWAVPPLKVGDRVSVELVRAEAVDPPPLRYPLDEAHLWSLLRAAQGAMDDKLAQLGAEPGTWLGRLQKRLLGRLRSR
jgi:hypothetical protein